MSSPALSTDNCNHRILGQLRIFGYTYILIHRIVLDSFAIHNRTKVLDFHRIILFNLQTTQISGFETYLRKIIRLI